MLISMLVSVYSIVQTIHKIIAPYAGDDDHLYGQQKYPVQTISLFAMKFIFLLIYLILMAQAALPQAPNKFRN